MKSIDIKRLYDEYGKKSAGKIAPDDQDKLKESLEAIKIVSNKTEAKKFLQLLTLLREAQARSIDGLGQQAMATIVGAFAGGDEGIYAGDTDLMNARFIFELVQNVDDCKYKDVNDCKLNIRFDIKNDVISLEYNELGFQPENVMAITGLGNSTKNHKKASDVKTEKELLSTDLQEIGEKGIGFKSIFGLAKNVKIISQYFNFGIDRENFFVPVVGDYSDFQYTDKTILELTLDDGMVGELYHFLKEKYDDVSAIVNENPILFLNKLTEIQYYASEDDFFGFRVSRGTINSEYTDEETRIEFFASDRSRNKVIDAYRFIHQIEYSVAECRARYGEQEDSTRKHKIVVIAPKRPDLIEEGRIYSFFATKERVNAPFIIHAPFRLNSGRTKIDSQSQGIFSNNAWFVRTKNETVRMIQYVYERLAERQGNKIRYYIPSLNLIERGCALRSSKLDKSSILQWNIFETVDGDYVPANEACLIDFPVSQEELIEIHSLLGIRYALLKVEPKEVNRFRDYEIRILSDVRNLLLRAVFNNEEKTARCLRYIGDYTPSFSLKDLNRNEIKLSYSQICIFSKYEKLSEWLNQHTFDSIMPGKPGAGTMIKSSYVGATKDIAQIQSFCEDYGDAINKQFVHYISHIRYVESDFEHTIFTYDHVFGRNMLKDFAEAYRKLDRKDKFFYPFLQIEAVSEEIDILCNKDDEISDFEFLQLLGGHRKNQKNMLGNQYKSILDLIENAGTNSERFFTELLQNMDDCMYRETPSAVIRYEKSGDNHKLICEYNEVGFSREQIRAITAIGDSTKKKLLSSETTGEKGVGFKSVFGICHSVTIESGNFSFRLSAEKPTVPEYIKEIDTRNGTRMVFTLKPQQVKQVIPLLNDVNRIIKNCLCLKKLHGFYINQKELTITDKPDRRVVSFNKKKFEFFLHKHPINVTNRMALHERRKAKDVLQKQEVCYLIPLNYPEEEYHPEYSVYSTFPTLEAIEIPMIINMPLELDTARERIRECEWNKEVIKQMMDGLTDVYERIKRIYKTLLPFYFPIEGRVLSHKYGQSHYILPLLAKSPLFKVLNNEEYYSLEKGIFTNDFEYGILKKYTRELSGYVPGNILEKNEEPFERLKKIYGNLIRQRTEEDTCKVINHLLNISSQNGDDLISHKEFRDALYIFLSANSTDNSAKLIMSWKIIPICFRKAIRYEAYSKDIYAPSGNNIDSEKYKILDANVMSESTFNGIYARMQGMYNPIQKFSRDVVIGEFFEELVIRLKTADLVDRASDILELYTSEKKLFEETYKARKDFPANEIPFVTRMGEVLFKGKCYLCNDPSSQGRLDQIIVANEYREMAKLLEIAQLEEISDCSQIPYVIGREELQELSNNKLLQKKNQIFNSLYLLETKSDELKDGEGFFELYVLTSHKLKMGAEQKKKIINLDENCLLKYAKEINEISIGLDPISFVVQVTLNEFEKDNILAEIEDELQVRKETERINRILGMLGNCFYFDLGRREPCCVREKNRDLFIIDTKISADYDVIEVLKAYFLAYFNTELSVNRNIRLYTRRGFENISTILSNDEEVAIAVDMLRNINVNIVEEVKDFVCKPLVIKGKTFGGYAKTCPLCNARVDTELTGMRVYKTKCGGKIIPLISCSNCHESLRYSSNIQIDMDQLESGIFNMDCEVNGFEWSVKDIPVRIGHRALIKKMNKEK